MCRLATWLAPAAVIVAVSGCGASSQSSTSSTTSSTSPSATIDTGPARGPSATAVEHALLAHGGPPAPTEATCHPASMAERASSPFGHTNLPVFMCTLTLRGKHGSYAVQVLRNGCFIAERRSGGQAVYGCGVSPS